MCVCSAFHLSACSPAAIATFTIIFIFSNPPFLFLVYKMARGLGLFKNSFSLTVVLLVVGFQKQGERIIDACALWECVICILEQNT